MNRNEFLNALAENINKEYNHKKTYNGADAYQSTMDAFVDFYGGLTQYRSTLMLNDDKKLYDVYKKFNILLQNDLILALKLLFYSRDVRGGQGEILIGRTLLTYLANTRDDVFEKVVDLIPFYGSWKDVVIVLANTTNEASREALLDLISRQLNKDVALGEDVSLMAKWLPSPTTKDKTKQKALRLIVRNLFNGDERKYRKTIVGLRKKINLFETAMTNKDYASVDYSQVPSKALKTHLKAVFRHDLERYRDFIAKVNKGEVKINSNVLTPYDIVSTWFQNQYKSDDDDTIQYLNGAWDNLPRLSKDVNNANILPLIDVSGSMYGTPMEVAIGLGMFVAEQNNTSFKNQFITFHSNPKLMTIDENATFNQKAKYVFRSDAGFNTDFDKVMKLILNTALKNNVTYDDMPDYLLVLSDMQFDSAFLCDDKEFQTLHQKYAKKFAENGLKMPVMIYWNLEQRDSAFPVKSSEEGTILLSGYSPSVLNLLMEGKIDELQTITPTTMMLKVLNSHRYQLIEQYISQ